MKKSIEFAFELNELVFINANKRLGKVTGLCSVKRTAVNRVNVEYVDDNGLVVDRWFDENDLSEQPK